MEICSTLQRRRRASISYEGSINASAVSDLLEHNDPYLTIIIHIAVHHDQHPKSRRSWSELESQYTNHQLVQEVELNWQSIRRSCHSVNHAVLILKSKCIYTAICQNNSALQCTSRRCCHHTFCDCNSTARGQPPLISFWSNIPHSAPNTLSLTNGKNNLMIIQ